MFAGFLILAVAACTEPKYRGIYELVLADGRVSPFQVDTAYDARSGDQYIGKWDTGTLFLGDANEVEFVTTTSNLINGVPGQVPSRTGTAHGSYYVDGDSARFYIDNAEFEGSFTDERQELTLRETTHLYSARELTFRKR